MIESLQLDLPLDSRIRRGCKIPYGAPLHEKYRVDEESKCWIWLGARAGGRNYREYGAVKKNGKTIPAHRAVYEEVVGPITPGMDLHHVCDTKLCVNPAHLQEVLPRHHRNGRRRY